MFCEPLALMVYVDRAPFSFADAYVLDILRVAPIPVRPVRHHVSSSLHLAIVPVSSGRSIGHEVFSVAGLGGAVDFLTGHDNPGDPRRLQLRCHPDHQQTPEIAVAHLGDAPHPLLAAARLGSGGQPQPGGKLAGRFELAPVAAGAEAVMGPIPRMVCRRRTTSLPRELSGLGHRVKLIPPAM